MTAYELTHPNAGQSVTYYEFIQGQLAETDQLIVSGLSGCMGLICVKLDPSGKPLTALMLHDADSGYPSAKREVEAFINSHQLQHMFVDFSAMERVNAISWMVSKGIARASIRPWPVPSTGILSRYANSSNKASAAERTETVDHQSQARVPLRKLDDTSPLWQRDATVDRCPLCQRSFKLSLRRHHCRNCGNIFCDDCCPKRVLGGHGAHFNKKLRYCKTCKPTLSTWDGEPESLS